MRLLLDTHTLLWWILGADRLPEEARRAILDRDNDVWVSAVSAVEVTTKVRIGKLPEAQDLANNFGEAVEGEGFSGLPISVDHAVLAGSMPIAHKDPFDRLLIAQAQIEQCWLVSNEVMFDSFGVRRLW